MKSSSKPKSSTSKSPVSRRRRKARVLATCRSTSSGATPDAATTARRAATPAWTRSSTPGAIEPATPRRAGRPRVEPAGDDASAASRRAGTGRAAAPGGSSRRRPARRGRRTRRGGLGGARRALRRARTRAVGFVAVGAGLRAMLRAGRRFGAVGAAVAVGRLAPGWWRSGPRSASQSERRSVATAMSGVRDDGPARRTPGPPRPPARPGSWCAGAGARRRPTWPWRSAALAALGGLGRLGRLGRLGGLGGGAALAAVAAFAVVALPRLVGGAIRRPVR